MLYINLSALSMEEAETMLKVIEKWARHFFNVYGVKRRTSWNARANGRAQIMITVDSDIWKKIGDGARGETAHRLGKSMFYCKVVDNCYEYCTLESSIL